MPRQILNIFSHFLIFSLVINFFNLPVLSQKSVQNVSGNDELRVDLLILNGQVLDGSGSKSRKIDIGISGDKIVFMGRAAKAKISVNRTIEASGMIVAPGFIDPHTHSIEDLSSLKQNNHENYLMQGVTTVITGNDGGGTVQIGETLEKWQRQGIGTNAALLVGQGAVRSHIMGSEDRAPTVEELLQMKNLVRRAMAEGAFGMSTGLFYAPGSFAKTEEVIELAKVAAENGGVYDTHLRDEGSYSIGLINSINETIRIGREAKIPVHISHIKALGTEVWGQSRDAIKIIKKARSEGVQITANQYPYSASGTNITAALVPRWAEAGGNSQLLERIKDPNVRPKLIVEMEANLKRRNGPEAILITRSKDSRLVGKTLAVIAKEWNKSPVEATLDIVSNGGASIASFNMNENDIENFMKQNFVMTGSDGSSGHPRKYGTFPRKLREYVLNKKLISLPFAIRASSSMTAKTFRIPERGLLKTGFFADVIVFDPKTITDKATYEQPEILAAGIKYVIVNGKIAVEDGKPNGTLAGRALRKGSTN